MTNQQTKLQLVRVVRTEQKHSPTADRRRRVNYTVAEYRDGEGNEYRKSFESYGQPVVPEFGTHKELNRLSNQR